MSDYQLIVIGAGPGGYTAALRAAKLGLKTAVIENSHVGGICLNRGCIPTKSLLHSAALLTAARNGEAFGVTAENITFDFSAMHAHKNQVIEQLRTGILQLFQRAEIDYLQGTASLIGTGQVRVVGKGAPHEYTADHILIATGSVPTKPPIPGFNLPCVLTSDDLLSPNARMYRSLIIIGGGVVGVEMASIYAALGCKVTILEAMSRILPTMEREVSQNMTMILKKRGVQVLSSCTVDKVASDATVYYQSKEQAATVSAEAILCAIGRRPNTDGFTGLNMEHGRIIVNADFETSLPNVYAVGDVTSKIQLAHVATAQGIAAIEHIAGVEACTDLNAVPSCIYTSPEIACVGLTADEAKERGRSVKVGKALMSANAKTVIENGERGFIKIVADADSGVILGAQLMCEHATELISELTSAVVNKLTVSKLRRVVRPHPTFGETVFDALDALK